MFTNFHLRLPNFHGFSVLNLCNSLFKMIGVSYSIPKSVSYIFKIRTPLQILPKVVSFHSVFMINLWKLFRIWNKCDSNKPVNFNCSSTCLFFVKMSQWIASSVFAVFKNFLFGSPRTLPIISSFRQTFHPPKIRDFIKSLVSLDWFEDFSYHFSRLMQPNISKLRAEKQGVLLFQPNLIL